MKNPLLEAVSLRSLVVAVLLTTAPAGLQAALAEDSPVLWPERERAFVADGPGLLLTRAERDSLIALDAAAREAWIDAFLAEDPIPDTALNELIEGIERRRQLVFAEYVSFLDDRAKVLFLHGTPAERHQVECGQTFQPIEIWTYPESVSSRQLLFYRRGTESAYRLWIPLDSKRSLYNRDMAYWMQQYEELRRFIQGKRFDLQACDDTGLVDRATGVAGLRGFKQGRPSNEELLALLEAPRSLKSWARSAAATVLPALPDELTVESPKLLFPERRGQRILARTLVTIPAGETLGLFEEEDGTQNYKLTVEGVVEQDGAVFEDFRMRFQLEPPADDVPIALAVDRPLRPERAYLLRLRVIDETTGAEAQIAQGVVVPSDADSAGHTPTATLVVVEMDEELSLQPLPGADGLLLAPPDGRLAVGTWRADALVSGDRIVEVVFSVDGRAQLRRKKPPFTADVRLSEYPTEQVVRAEGFDAEGELVAFDEVVLNQPRGAFSVRITSPGKNEKVSGLVPVRAEIAIPEERRIEKVDFLLNDELVASLDDDPWRIELETPETAEQGTTYLTVVATLDDGARAEAVRFLNSPQFVEALEVNLVEMLATVLDRGNRPVSGLGREAFTVLEDGRRQMIDRFERVEDLPLSIGITIDTSGSMATVLPEAQEAALSFLESVMSPKDQAFVVAFAREAELLMPPTDDLRALEASLADLQSLGWTALHDAIVTSLYYFRGFRGQRALVLLSDGDDSASRYAFREALEYARRSGVVVYTVGLNVGTMKTGIRGKLNALASETGGRSFFIRQAEELVGVYEEIEEELRSQYFIAYNSDNQSADGEFRTIELVVDGGKLTARTLRGYYPK